MAVVVSHILEAPTTKTTEEKSQRPFHYDFLFFGGTTPHDEASHSQESRDVEQELDNDSGDTMLDLKLITILKGETSIPLGSL